MFYTELQVDGAGQTALLNVTLKGTLGECELSLSIVPDMHKYEFELSESIGEINSVRVKPSAIECVMRVKAMGFKA